MIRFESASPQFPGGRIICEIGSAEGSPFTFRCMDASTGAVRWETPGMMPGHWSAWSSPKGCHAELVDSSGRRADYFVWKEELQGVLLDYVEIGTSDFETLVESSPDSFRGLSVEPMRCYLDRLPEAPNNRKLNLAVSDRDSKTRIFYVDPSDIASHSMPDWVKGCNSIGREHPGVARYLSANGLGHLYRTAELDCVSFGTLASSERIAGIGYLKIDTEGHDFAIIRSMLGTGVRPAKIRFETNSLYSEQDILAVIGELESSGYRLIQRTANDTVVRLVDRRDFLGSRPVMVISTGRRLEYLTRTIRSLFDSDPDFADKVESVWVLDDRSSALDRMHMDKMMASYFPGKYTSVCFNGQGEYDFVEKFRFIRKVVSPEGQVLLMEDDWQCCGDLSLGYHASNLAASDWSQISFCDPLEIQEPATQRACVIDSDYWRNPYPGYFKHPHRWDGDVCHWKSVRIDNWTNNPSLVKGSVFHGCDFNKVKNFEWEFAQAASRKAVFTNECLFRHIGENSLIDALR